MHAFWIALDRLLWRIRRFFHPTVTQIAPGYEGYGGATITRRVDGAGAEWIACCARGPDGYFGFYAFKNGANVPLSPRVSGRGSIHDDGYWIAWEGSTHHKGTLPGWTPLAKGGDTSALEAEIDALEAQIATLEYTIAHLPPTVTGPIVSIPARNTVDGAMLYLYAATGAPWLLDVAASGNLRVSRDGIVYERWPNE